MSAPVPWEFATAGRIVFGRGTASQAPAIVGGLATRQAGKGGRRQAGGGAARVLVVSGARPIRAEWLLNALREHGASPTLLVCQREPDVAFAASGAAVAASQDSQVVVAVGGGSALDTGKAIAALATNRGDVFDYLEVVGRGLPLQSPPLPFVAIPTTAGTGSEVTRNAVLTVPDRRVKVSLRSPLMLPRVAIIDPELTFSMTPEVTAFTGLDALAQNIEPFLSRKANPLTDAICREGMRRAARSLRTAVGASPPADGQDAAAREDMCVASLCGGLALANAGLGAVHGLAGVIGGMFAAPHGAVCAALLAPVLGANVAALARRDPGNAVRTRADEVARLLTGSPAATASDGVEWLAALVRDLRIPRLSAWGLAQSDIPAIVEQGARSSSMKGNPITLALEELAGVMQEAL